MDVAKNPTFYSIPFILCSRVGIIHTSRGSPIRTKYLKFNKSSDMQFPAYKMRDSETTNYLKNVYPTASVVEHIFLIAASFCQKHKNIIK